MIKPTPETKFNIPGKTFLVGEYAVLLGGSALGLATAPYFEVSFSPDETSFHPQSPAGRYLLSRGADSEVAFLDQYQSGGVQGGFGRSTAEFLAVMTVDLLKGKKSAFDILKLYRDLHSDQKVRPSGMDLIFQLLGSVTYVDQQLNLFQNFDWNFLNSDFFIISSGLKVQTHDHLAALKLDELKELPELSDYVCKMYAENKEDEFLYQMKEWTALLNGKKLTHENSQQIKNLIQSEGTVKLVKPCGALGADVLLVFFDRVDKLQVQNFLKDKKFNIVASSKDLANGLISQLRPFWSQNVG